MGSPVGMSGESPVEEDGSEQMLLVHLQQARKFADFLPGGRSHDTVVSEHVFSPEEAANHLRHELDLALAVMGARA